MPKGTHPMVELQRVSEDQEVTYCIEKNWDHITNYKGVKKVHEVHGHKSEANLLHAYKGANLLTPGLKEVKKRVVVECIICQRFKKSSPRPKSALPKASDFNQIVTLDLKEIDRQYILWIICSFSRYMQGVLIPNKRAETIVNALNSTWNHVIGFISIGFWANNGG